MGEVHPDVADNYGFMHRTAAAELDFDALAEIYSTDFTYTSLPRYPALERDFSFVCEEALQVGDVEDEIRAAALADDKVKAATAGMQIVKSIVIKNKIVNFVVKPQ